jgi:hypothetical protein
MSIVKIHLPFYTKNILLKAISLMNDTSNLIVQDIKELNNDKDLYKNIGNYIFKQDKYSKLFLLGDTKGLDLPIPITSKILLKDKNISKTCRNKYLKLQYAEMEETDIIHELEGYMKSPLFHIGGFERKNGEMFKLDVYKLWFYSHNLNPVKFTVSNVMEYVFGTDDIDIIKDMKMWGKVSLNNINDYPDHVQRLHDADTTYPIIMTMYNKKPKLLDGTHRLLKAFVTNKKHIKVKLIENKILKKATYK